MAKKRRLLTEGVITLMVFGLVGGMLFANVAQRMVGGTAGKTVLGAIAGGRAHAGFNSARPPR